MEEAQESADRIAIMDHGKIVSEGTVDELLHKTETETLEQAFLALTGSEIREEEAAASGKLMRMKMRSRGH